ALRGHHRNLPAAGADVRGSRRRRHLVSLHRLALRTAHHDAHGRPPEGALRPSPRPSDRARRTRARPHAPRTGVSPAGADVLGALPVDSSHLALPRGEPRAGLSRPPGGRSTPGPPPAAPPAPL